VDIQAETRVESQAESPKVEVPKADERSRAGKNNAAPPLVDVEIWEGPPPKAEKEVASAPVDEEKDMSHLHDASPDAPPAPRAAKKVASEGKDQKPPPATGTAQDYREACKARLKAAEAQGNPFKYTQVTGPRRSRNSIMNNH
jgi:hypothetical protein